MRQLAFSLLAGIAVLATPARAEAKAEYDLRSLASKIHQWCIQSAGDSAYKWEKTKAELRSATEGATITFPLAVNAAKVIVVDGRAEYTATADKCDTEWDDGGTGLSWRANAIGGTVTCRSTEEYSDYQQWLFQIQVTIRDTADRLALDLSGRQRINVTGRVRSIAIVPIDHKCNIASDRGPLVMRIEVDVTTWVPAKG